MERRDAFGAIERAKYFSEHNDVDFAVEDLHFATTLDDVQKVADLDPIYVGFTWNDDNNLASGANGFGGLTEFGSAAVKVFETSGVQIDTAHLNEKSFLEFSRVSEKPIFCSHSAIFSLKNHPRNLKDYQLKIIEETGGLFGLCLVSDFLTEDKRANIDDVVKHIDYFVCGFGIDHISVGSDFYGTSLHPKGISGYKTLLKVKNKLLSLGYAIEDVEKIFFKNAYDFFNK